MSIVKAFLFMSKADGVIKEPEVDAVLEAAENLSDSDKAALQSTYDNERFESAAARDKLAAGLKTLGIAVKAASPADNFTRLTPDAQMKALKGLDKAKVFAAIADLSTADFAKLDQTVQQAVFKSGFLTEGASASQPKIETEYLAYLSSGQYDVSVAPFLGAQGQLLGYRAVANAKDPQHVWDQMHFYTADEKRIFMGSTRSRGRPWE